MRTPWQRVRDSSLQNSNSTAPSDPDSALVGPTLRVYRLLLTSREALAAREVQKRLQMSTPSLAIFHLEKLERLGLASKSADGHYSVSKLYLKHYFRLRRFLIPRYVFHSALATFFLFGWIVLCVLVYFSPNSLLSESRAPSLAVGVLLSYGIVVAAVLAGLFWFETSRVLKQDKI